MTPHSLRTPVLLGLLVALLGPPAAGAADVRVLDTRTVRIPVTGDRAVPVRLPQAVTIDVTSDSVQQPPGIGLAPAPEGAFSRYAPEFGVALVQQGRPDGAVVAAVYDQTGRPVLSFGQTGRIGPDREADRAATCTRCELPAGTYDLFIFGGPRRLEDDDPRAMMTLTLDGLAAGAAAIGEAEGRSAVVLTGSVHYASKIPGSTGGGASSAVFPLGYDGVAREGIHVAQAAFATKASSGGAAISMVAQASVRPRQLPAGGVPYPVADAYGAAAGATPGPYVVRTSSVSTLAGMQPAINAAADGDFIGADSWTVDVAHLWLTTTQSPDSAPPGATSQQVTTHSRGAEAQRAPTDLAGASRIGPSGGE